MRKRMTSLWTGIGICVMIVFAFGACGDKVTISEDMTPTETVEAFLDSFKQQEWDNMDLIYAGKSDDFASFSESSSEEGKGAVPLMDEFKSKMRDFDYEVTGEEISKDGKTASVDITISTYNLKEVFDNYYQEYMGQALDVYSGKSSEMTQEDLEKMANEILQEQLDAATEKTYKGDATLTLTLTDGRWVVDRIDESNPAFLNAISGGMMDVAQDVIDTNEEYNGGNSIDSEKKDNKDETEN